MTKSGTFLRYNDNNTAAKKSWGSSTGVSASVPVAWRRFFSYAWEVYSSYQVPLIDGTRKHIILFLDGLSSNIDILKSKFFFVHPIHHGTIVVKKKKK